MIVPNAILVGRYSNYTNSEVIFNNLSFIDKDEFVLNIEENVRKIYELNKNKFLGDISKTDFYMDCVIDDRIFTTHIDRNGLFHYQVTNFSKLVLVYIFYKSNKASYTKTKFIGKDIMKLYSNKESFLRCNYFITGNESSDDYQIFVLTQEKDWFEFD